MISDVILEVTPRPCACGVYVAEKLESVTDANFSELVKSAPGLIVVEFGGDWCPPCVALEPVLAGLAQEWRGRAKFYKLDTEANPEAPAELGVRGLPTILFFKGGQVVERLVGAQPRKKLQGALERQSSR